MDTKKERIKKAFEGLDRDLIAQALGLARRNYVDQVATGNCKVSAKRARQLEKITLGKVPAKILRPDIFE